jgi:hypothetical protein
MKKLALKVFVLFCIFTLIAPHPAQALFGGGGGSINPVKMMNQIFADLGVDKPELKNSIKTFNVSRVKKDAPTVKISFDPPHPVEGEIVTAIAQPNSFLNDSSQLYYTWYIKHADGSGSMKEAMGAIARGSFEPTEKTYVDKKHGDDDTDEKSGYKPTFGGEGSFDMANEAKRKCFQHDFTSGNEYPIQCEHLFYDDTKSLSWEEEEEWGTDPNEQSTAKNGRSDGANIVGLGAFQFSWVYRAGDKVSVAVEGTSIEPTQDKDASYKVMWAVPMDKNKCASVSIGDEYNNAQTGTVTTVESGPDSASVKTITETTVINAGAYDQITYKIYSDNVTKTTVMKYYPVCMEENQPGGFGGGLATCADIQWPGYPSSADPNAIDYPGAPDSMTTTTTGDQNAVSTNNSPEFKGTIEECAKDNYVDPLDEGATQKLDVALSYGPKNPINNVSDPDRLIISSAVTGTDDTDGLMYEWTVSKANNLSDKWNTLSETSIPELSTANGIGLSDLKFNLALTGQGDNSKFYLKIKVDVSKKLPNGEQSGTAFITVPVLVTNKTIDVYPTKLESNQMKNDFKNAKGESNQRCDSGMEKILCPSVKNEIIGLSIKDLGKYENYSWSVNGRKLNEVPYGKYSEDDSVVAYYPVLGELGNQFTISFSATDKVNGQTISLSKAFEVAEPKVKIVCAPGLSGCDPELLGYYINMDDKKEPDFSEDSFLVTQGATVSLAVEKNMTFDKNFQWYVDSVPVVIGEANPFGATVEATTGVLTLPVNKNLDEAYSVSYSSDYYQDRAIMKLLNAHHGVNFNQFYEKKLGDSVELKVGYVSTVAANNKNKSLASIITNTSNYFNFLFRIVLTIGLLLFTTRIIFSLIPNRIRI